MDDEDRIALFVDYENLALGARDHLGGGFDLRPIMDALAERGRVVVRRAYADWSYFDEDRRMLTRNQVELIEMTQRMGASRKNAADIKMAVDAVELAFVRDYVSTFAICTGDSDFTPLVHKLRELNKRVIGFGVRDSTSKMLPPACDEFLFYDNLQGAGEETPTPPPAARRQGKGKDAPGTGPSGSGGRDDGAGRDIGRDVDPGRGEETDLDAEDAPVPTPDVADLAVLVAQTVAGLQGSQGEVTASVLKRTLLRKDPTFSETDHGFRAFGELLRHLADRGVVELVQGPAKGDPEVTLPDSGPQDDAFAALREVVGELTAKGEGAALSGLKDQIRRVRPGFSEKALGYRSFLQFARAAATAGVVSLDWSTVDKDYLLEVPEA